mmetsp:Transcript_47872/g.93518  ORF Transcript_47872/g.93518 Transcript_47872/m.93518 type:complete len:218 (+) Transcript_47872:997-1650(+)
MGRKIVCRVDVRMTALRVLRMASADVAAPSSSSSGSSPSSASGSNISTTFPTRYGSCLFSLIFSRFSRTLSLWLFVSCTILWTSLRIIRISLSRRRMRVWSSPEDMPRTSGSSRTPSSSSSASTGSERFSSPPGGGSASAAAASPQISSPSRLSSSAPASAGGSSVFSSRSDMLFTVRVSGYEGKNFGAARTQIFRGFRSQVGRSVSQSVVRFGSVY